MTHNYALQVFYEDTDVAGVVYHANYVKFMERARTTLLQEKGFSLTTLMNTGMQFVVRSVRVSYERPARLQENLVVVTKITKLGKVSMIFNQNIYFDPNDTQTMICSGEVVIVCTNLQFKPCAIPEAILRELKSEN